MGTDSHPTKQARKPEFVESLAKLFAEAASGQTADKDMAERFNRWLPVNLRVQPQAELAAGARESVRQKRVRPAEMPDGLLLIN